MRREKKMVAYIADNGGEIFGRHNLSKFIENQVRLDTALEGIPKSARKISPKVAEMTYVEAVHSNEYLKEILLLTMKLKPGKADFIDTDTYVTRDSFEVASYAAGSAITAVDVALGGENCFALVRPPGHHAGPDYAKGFCIVNNVAVAAKYACEKVDKVAIIDWDLHHGNGTQEIFYNDNRVFYCSVHGRGIFPGTGSPLEIGEGPGEGFNLNVPLDGDSGSEEYLMAFKKEIIPAVEEFGPDLILISAGQDALSDDPMGFMNLEPEDYGTFTRLVCDISPGPLALILEGGYGPSHGMAIAEIWKALSHE